MRRWYGELNDFSIKEIAQICSVSTRTARRWKQGTSCPPRYVIAILAGDLGAFSDYWEGWRIKRETIISPEGWEITRNSALSVPLLVQQIAILKAELRKATETLALEEQPAPPEVMPLIG